MFFAFVSVKDEGKPGSTNIVEPYGLSASQLEESARLYESGRSRLLVKPLYVPDSQLNKFAPLKHAGEPTGISASQLEESARLYESARSEQSVEAVGISASKGNEIDVSSFFSKPNLSTIPRPNYERMLDEIKKSGGDSIISPVVLAEEMTNLDGTGRLLKIFPKLVKGVERCKCIIGTPRNPSEPWNAYKATVELQSAVSNLLLPDVSDLPLSGIFEIRDRTKDLLDPMRAELLRFTETLRQMVKEARNDPDALRHEAENLVRTKIEPVVREAGHKARRIAEQKWRKLFSGAAKAFGLTTATLIDPKLYAKAVAQTVETGVQAFQTPEDKAPDPKVTAQFVLEAHSFLTGK